MPRFVVLEHCLPPGHARALHWDLMLEAPGGLRTWALSAAPASGAKIAADQITAEQLPLHRSEYLDYQGPVSGDRGSVTRWDQGTFRWLADEPQRVEIHFEGSRLAGRAVLEQLPGEAQSWLFTCLAG